MDIALIKIFIVLTFSLAALLGKEGIVLLWRKITKKEKLKEDIKRSLF